MKWTFKVNVYIDIGVFHMLNEYSKKYNVYKRKVALKAVDYLLSEIIPNKEKDFVDYIKYSEISNKSIGSKIKNTRALVLNIEEDKLNTIDKFCKKHKITRNSLFTHLILLYLKENSNYCVI